MKKSKNLFTFLILLTIKALIINSCARTHETVSCFPNNSINVILNLNLPAYQNLQYVSGWIYVNEQNSGSRGLIIVKNGGGFKVYDRNAPHICPDSNTTLEVKDNIKIYCAKDGAEWILLTGEPSKIAQLPPKSYPYSYDPSSNVLTVYN